jgi:hypothetical protein
MRTEYTDGTLKLFLLDDDIGISEIHLTLTSEPIVCRTRKLKKPFRVRWAPEYQQDFNYYSHLT